MIFVVRRWFQFLGRMVIFSIFCPQKTPPNLDFQKKKIKDKQKRCPLYLFIVFFFHNRFRFVLKKRKGLQIKSTLPKYQQDSSRSIPPSGRIHALFWGYPRLEKKNRSKVFFLFFYFICCFWISDLWQLLWKKRFAPSPLDERPFLQHFYTHSFVGI